MNHKADLPRQFSDNLDGDHGTVAGVARIGKSPGDERTRTRERCRTDAAPSWSCTSAGLEFSTRPRPSVSTMTYRLRPWSGRAASSTAPSSFHEQNGVVTTLLWSETKGGEPMVDAAHRPSHREGLGESRHRAPTPALSEQFGSGGNALAAERHGRIIAHRVKRRLVSWGGTVRPSGCSGWHRWRG